MLLLLNNLRLKVNAITAVNIMPHGITIPRIIANLFTVEDYVDWLVVLSELVPLLLVLFLSVVELELFVLFVVFTTGTINYTYFILIKGTPPT